MCLWGRWRNKVFFLFAFLCFVWEEARLFYAWVFVFYSVRRLCACVCGGGLWVVWRSWPLLPLCLGYRLDKWALLAVGLPCGRKWFIGQVFRRGVSGFPRTSPLLPVMFKLNPANRAHQAPPSRRMVVMTNPLASCSNTLVCLAEMRGLEKTPIKQSLHKEHSLFPFSLYILCTHSLLIDLPSCTLPSLLFAGLSPHQGCFDLEWGNFSVSFV